MPRSIPGLLSLTNCLAWPKCAAHACNATLQFRCVSVGRCRHKTLCRQLSAGFWVRVTNSDGKWKYFLHGVQN